MSWTDDPIRDAETFANDADRWLEARPVCCQCGEHIQDEDAYEICGDMYCDDCAHDWLQERRVNIDNLLAWRD